jgi:hypothetical protein
MWGDHEVKTYVLGTDAKTFAQNLKVGLNHQQVMMDF